MMARSTKAPSEGTGINDTSKDDTSGPICIQIIRNQRDRRRSVSIRQLITELTSHDPTGIGTEIRYIFREKNIVVQFAKEETVHRLLSDVNRLNKYGITMKKFTSKFLARGREDECSLLMMGLRSASSDDVIKQLKATKELRNVKLTLEWVSATSVLATCAEKIKDFTSIRNRIQTSLPNVVVTRVFCRTIVHVKNIDERIDQEALELYFNRPAVGGGDVEHIHLDNDTKEAVIQFENYEVTSNVLLQTHQLDGIPLQVEPYNFFVDEKDLETDNASSSGTDTDGSENSAQDTEAESKNYRQKYFLAKKNLKDTLISKTKEIERLQEMLMESESLCEYKETLIQKLQMEVRQLEDQIKDIVLDFERHTADSKEKSEQFGEYAERKERELAKAQKDNDKLRAQLGNLEKLQDEDNNREQEIIEKLQLEKKEIEGEVDELSRKCENQQSKISELQQWYDQLQKEFTSTKRILKDQTDYAQWLKREKRDSEIENEDLREKLQQAQRETGDLKEELEQALRQTENLIEELNQVKNEKEDLKEELQQVQNSMSDLKVNGKRETAVLEQNLKQAENAIRDLEAKYAEEKNKTKIMEERRTTLLCMGGTGTKRGPVHHEVDGRHLSAEDLVGLTANGGIHRAKYKGEDVAVKDFGTPRSTSGFGATSFFNCYDKITSFSGSNCVKTFGIVYDQANGTHLLVMEYVKHKSLRLMLRVNFTGLSLEEKRKLALSLCECVQMLHDADIPLILGKISSNKFLVGEDMRVKMYDLAYCGKPEMAARYLKGKNREYMPSDDIAAIEGSYDEKTECFIVGIILMEIVTGKSPSEAIRSQQAYPDPFHKVIRGLQEPDRSKRMAMKDAARELQKS